MLGAAFPTSGRAARTGNPTLNRDTKSHSNNATHCPQVQLLPSTPRRGAVACGWHWAVSLGAPVSLGLTLFSPPSAIMASVSGELVLLSSSPGKRWAVGSGPIWLSAQSGSVRWAPAGRWGQEPGRDRHTVQHCCLLQGFGLLESSNHLFFLRCPA